MENQNPPTDTAAGTENEPIKANPEGINQWNDRLDENLESEQTGDTEADEKAREYSAKNGSGDQSDEQETP